MLYGSDNTDVTDRDGGSSTAAEPAAPEPSAPAEPASPAPVPMASVAHCQTVREMQQDRARRLPRPQSLGDKMRDLAQEADEKQASSHAELEELKKSMAAQAARDKAVIRAQQQRIDEQAAQLARDEAVIRAQQQRIDEQAAQLADKPARDEAAVHAQQHAAEERAEECAAMMQEVLSETYYDALPDKGDKVLHILLLICATAAKLGFPMQKVAACLATMKRKMTQRRVSPPVQSVVVHGDYRQQTVHIDNRGGTAALGDTHIADDHE